MTHIALDDRITKMFELLIGIQKKGVISPTTYFETLPAQMVDRFNLFHNQPDIPGSVTIYDLRWYSERDGDEKTLTAYLVTLYIDGIKSHLVLDEWGNPFFPLKEQNKWFLWRVNYGELISMSTSVPFDYRKKKEESDA